MPKDKYPSIFSPQMEAIVFIILQIFFATRAVLKIGEYSRIFPSFSWGIFGHVTRLAPRRLFQIYETTRALIRGTRLFVKVGGGGGGLINLLQIVA